MKPLFVLTSVLLTQNVVAASLTCAPKSAELKLANACYTGAMQLPGTTTDLAYVGVAEDSNFEYCHNALVMTSNVTTPFKNSMINVVKDSGDNARIHNFVIPPGAGKSPVALRGLDAVCRSKNNESCPNDRILNVAYAGSPGTDVHLDAVSTRPPEKKQTVLSEANGNQDLPQLSSRLVKDIDDRLKKAAVAVEDSAKGAVKDGDRAVVKSRADQVLDCFEAARGYRDAHNLSKPDAALDKDRRELLAAVQKLKATGQPTGYAPAGDGAGSAK